VEVDWFGNSLVWARPVGRTHPYSLNLTINTDADPTTVANSFNWTLFVEPSYTPVLLGGNIVDSTSQEKNGFVISGKIILQQQNNETNQKGKLIRRLPIQLNVFSTGGSQSLGSQSSPLDTIDFCAQGPELFNYWMLPYSPMNRTFGNLFIVSLSIHFYSLLKIIKFIN
jgi:hypothetical protein